MKMRVAVVVVCLTLVGGAIVAVQGPSPATTVWQQSVNPGKLSHPHAFLDQRCSDCHTPVKGVEASNCIVCHANDEDLLQRQPTAFHGTIGSCKECHTEHIGRVDRPITMDHSALVDIGLRQLSSRSNNSESHDRSNIAHYLNDHISLDAKSSLNCAACHSKEDPHSGQFGLSCGSCHTTERWSIPSYRHPSPRSRDCAQCHLSPPCHRTSHFRMVCAQVAGKPDAKLNECFQCHQNTAWNDIKGVGWFKTH